LKYLEFKLKLTNDHRWILRGLVKLYEFHRGVYPWEFDKLNADYYCDLAEKAIESRRVTGRYQLPEVDFQNAKSMVTSPKNMEELYNLV
jgi:hypothetical protein